ncbi:hypothetical protein PS9374_00998 [Planomonospora sphaerica]|uniref:Uncharacterized protein n=1 Tax=Planomonospora sphaerica TaxID=161355 RepID=A0A171BNG2_9ACTN|nr:hypothetical protein [Planomonospora sphaerica]GAT65365.1 hypothetical protein PS9374_00998 [Planomonospora sphaerica]
MGDGFSGIDPAAMDDFERGLGRAEDALGRGEPRVRAALEKLDLDTSALGALREARSWIGSSRPDLRRRSEAIRSERTEWGSSGLPGGLAAFDESRYGKASRDPDVYAATVKLAEAAEKGEIDTKTVAELEKRTGDSTFTTALLTSLGATTFRSLLMGTAKGSEKQAKRLETALGKAMGTASPRLGKSWIDELTAPLSSSPAGQQGQHWKYEAITRALRHGTFSTAFLVTLARKIDAWDRTSDSMGTYSKVMVPLMETLARHPEAAQDFFAGDPTAMKHHLTNPSKMSDDGVALGKALEAAMLRFRDHSGTPDKPSRGYWSAMLASQFIHIEAERIKNGHPPDSAVKPTFTGLVLSEYIRDVNRSAQTVAQSSVPAVQGADNPSAPGQDPWGAQFNREELRRVMKEAFKDSEAFALVTSAQTAFSGWLLDHAAAEMAVGRGDGALLTNARRIGAGFGLITDTAELLNIEEGKELDEAQKRNMKVLLAAVNTGLAFPQTGAWPILSGVTGSWTGLLEDIVKGDAESNAREAANTTVDRTRNLVHDLTAQAMLKHGLFGPAEPAASTHPWASLEDMRKGDDPRRNPNNFLKDDGRALMSREEMIDETAANDIDKDRRFEAYQRWLYEGPSGRPWREVEDRLDQGFSNGFTQYGS